MKRIYFACLFLCLTTTFFFAQLQLPLSDPQAAQGGPRPRVELQRGLPLPNPGPLGLGDRLHRAPFSPWNERNGAFPRNIQRAGMWAANSASNPIFFEAPTYGSGGEYAESVAVADLNGDGKLDLVVANGNSVDVLLGNGDGTFQPAVSYGSSGGTDVAVADVNGDGKLDLVVANYCTSSNCTTSSVGVLLGNGDGTFQPAVTYSSGGYSNFSVAVADVNGDGKPDLVVVNYCANSNCSTDGTVGVLLGNGDGTFQPVVTHDAGGYFTVAVAVADVNGDGKPDLLVANNCASSTNCANGSVSVLLGNGDGTFKPAASYGSGGYEAESVAVADVNGDGKPDLLVANAICLPLGVCGTGSVGVLLGNGDGTFQPVVTYDSGGFSAESVAVADVNRDGKPDLVVANTCVNYGAFNCMTGTVSVLLGNGDGTFQAAASYDSGGTGASSVAVADVNGDGKPDLLVANDCGNYGNYGCTAGSVAVLLNTGDGSFYAAPNYSTGGYEPNSVAGGDLNGDGNPDLVVANQSVNRDSSDGIVGVLLGNGNGTFQPAVTYNSGGYIVASVAVADVNRDGNLDLLVANQCTESSCESGSGDVGVLLGNGDGTFQPAVNYGLEGSPNSVVVADVNGDGKPDLVVASYGTVEVLLGNGDGTFQPPLENTTGLE